MFIELLEAHARARTESAIPAKVLLHTLFELYIQHATSALHTHILCNQAILAGATLLLPLLIFVQGGRTRITSLAPKKPSQWCKGDHRLRKFSLDRARYVAVQLMKIHATKMSTIQPSIPRLQHICYQTVPMQHILLSDSTNAAHCVIRQYQCNAVCKTRTDDRKPLEGNLVGTVKQVVQGRDSLVAEESKHRLIHGLLLPSLQRTQCVQVVHLTHNQTIHRPEDGVDVREPNPASTECQRLSDRL